MKYIYSFCFVCNIGVLANADNIYLIFSAGLISSFALIQLADIYEGLK